MFYKQIKLIHYLALFYFEGLLQFLRHMKTNSKCEERWYICVMICKYLIFMNIDIIL